MNGHLDDSDVSVIFFFFFALFHFWCDSAAKEQLPLPESHVLKAPQEKKKKYCTFLSWNGHTNDIWD